MNSSSFFSPVLLLGLLSAAFITPAAADHWWDDHVRGGHGHYDDRDDYHGGRDHRWSFHAPSWEGSIDAWLGSMSYGWVAGVLSVIGAGLSVLWRLVRLVRELRGNSFDGA